MTGLPRITDERGVTLVELLIASMLMLIVSAAALTTLDQFVRMGGNSERRLDQQDRVRTATREIVGDLRDVAASPERPTIIESAGDYDVVFKTVEDGAAAGANTMRLQRYRYCLDSHNRSSATVQLQTQSWTTATPPAIPSTASCPSAAWGSSKVVVENITNRAGSQERPMFTYRQTAAGEVQSISVKLYLDIDPAKEPPEALAETGVFLRNQNRVPVATFTATPAGIGHILLNASESVDPEDQPVEVHWFDAGKPLGRGTIFDYNAKTRGVHSITVEVVDVGGLVGRYGPVSVVVP
jgi:prepilin-type N-terminal cleavage/methylation domain-containing protein